MLGLRLLERWVSTFVIITVYFISHSLITGFDISCRLCMCRDCDSCLSFLSRAFQFVCCLLVLNTRLVGSEFGVCL